MLSEDWGRGPECGVRGAARDRTVPQGQARAQTALKLPARVWKAALLEGVLQPDLSSELGRIEAPTLIFWGDQDALTGDAQEALTAAIPRSRLVTYAGAGHGLHWEEPERFAADLTTFVDNAKYSAFAFVLISC